MPDPREEQENLNRVATVGSRLWRRLRLAWRYRVWPWDVPANVVTYIGLEGPTEADVRRGEELAKEMGWE
jgi:hypothetical protein